MRSTFFASLAALAGAVSAYLEPLESLRRVPEGWKEIGRPDAAKKLHFRIAVAQPNEEVFEQTLLDISTPSHPKYGQHLSHTELKRMLRPEQEATNSVLTWLSQSGIQQDDIEDDGDWINFLATVSQAEKMMDTTFAIYESTVRSAVQKIRTLAYSVPEGLHAHIDMIQPTTRFGEIRPQGSHVLYHEPLGTVGSARTKIATSCNTTITPQCLKDLYKIKGFTPSKSTANGNFLGINGFLEQYARYSDLAKFESTYAPWAVGQNFSWTSVNGGILDQNSNDDSVEANLDIQYTLSLSYPLRNNYYSTSGRGPLVPDLDQPLANVSSNEPYLDLFTYLLKQPDDKLPATLTTSYGENEQSVPETYARKVCSLIAQLGARGTSVIFSSGDTGVAAACQTNDGKNTTRFLPIFPAACPYVTSVGGTYQMPERAVSFSSGGFSDLWARPKWQDSAVGAYLEKLGDKWKGLYNPSGRGFPDVAAQGYNFHVVDRGLDQLVGGTSASAPTFAAVVSLLNSARIAKGLPKLGWLNPWIYSEGYKGLNDVTLGGSKGCTGVDQYSGLKTPVVAGASWNATEGWDPVTGWGTPNFQKLLGLAVPGKHYGQYHG